MESKKRSLEEFLVEDKRMHSKIKYEEANELFQSEKVWTAVNDELIRRKLFEKALPTILGREVKLMKVKREQNIENLKKLFKSNKMIMYDTTWAEAQQLLLEDESFENDENLQSNDLMKNIYMYLCFNEVCFLLSPMAQKFYRRQFF